MPTVLSHAISGIGIGACFYRPVTPKTLFLLGAVCAAFPDIDVIAFSFGVRYGDFWGHRGFTHSIAFAALLSAVIVALNFRSGSLGLGPALLFAYLFLATASHGLLDALTDGGLGVALFSPFNNGRYFFPWTPIHVSPIGLARFFTHRGLVVLYSEFLWVWIPSALLFAFGWLLHWRHSSAT